MKETVVGSRVRNKERTDKKKKKRTEIDKGQWIFKGEVRLENKKGQKDIKPRFQHLGLHGNGISTKQRKER